MIAVSAPHRADALAACQDAIDRLKERVPLWKKEVYDGGEEWIGTRLMSRRPTATTTRSARAAATGAASSAALFGPLIAGAIALAKFSFVLLKFGSIFIAVGAVRALLRLEVRRRASCC